MPNFVHAQTRGRKPFRHFLNGDTPLVGERALRVFLFRFRFTISDEDQRHRELLQHECLNGLRRTPAALQELYVQTLQERIAIVEFRRQNSTAWPAIQSFGRFVFRSFKKAILFLPAVEEGRDPVTERDLRRIVGEASWRKQRRLWQNDLGSLVS